MKTISWLDYTVLNNPNGVMLVLAKYGYVGWMAPEGMAEVYEATHMLIQRYGDSAIEDLLRAHPDYDMIRSLPAIDNPTAYRGFTGDIIPEKNRSLMIAAGVFLAAYLIFK